MKYKYKDHLAVEEICIKGYDYDLKNNPEYETFLSFDQWKTFYHVDREHWKEKICGKNAYSSAQKCRIPYYLDKNKEYHFIKFKTARDFRRYCRYMKKINKRGEDYENLQEVTQLAELFRAISNTKAEEAMKKTQEAYDNMVKIVDNCEQKVKNNCLERDFQEILKGGKK